MRTRWQFLLAVCGGLACGSAAGEVLWDQPLSPLNQNAYVNQQFPDVPTYTTVLADDFVASVPWQVGTLFVPGDGWNGFSTLQLATALHWAVYPDAGGVPAGHPGDGVTVPAWSISLPPGDPQITVDTGVNGWPSNTTLQLAEPFTLPAGRWWLMAYPDLTYSPGGQYGRHVADGAAGFSAKLINPGGGFGLGTGWLELSAIGASETGLAFRIDGAPQALDVWTPIETEPDGGRMDNVVAAWNGRVWSITGYGVDGVRVYDRASGHWSVVAGSASPFGQTYARSGCQAGSKVFIYGDAATSGFSGLWSYDLQENAWTAHAPAGTGPAQTGIWAPAWVYEEASGLCYLTGGGTAPGGGDLATVHVYDPAADAWLDPLPAFTTARDFHAAFLMSDMLCVVGGAGPASAELSSSQCFDFAANAWNAENADVPALPQPLWGMGYATRTGPYGDPQFWLVAGVTGGAAQSASWFHDAGTGRWFSGGNLKTGAVYRNAAVTLDNVVFKLGGSVGSFQPTGLSERQVSFDDLFADGFEDAPLEAAAPPAPLGPPRMGAAGE